MSAAVVSDPWISCLLLCSAAGAESRDAGDGPRFSRIAIADRAATDEPGGPEGTRAPSEGSTEALFLELVARWKAERNPFAPPTVAAMHPAYQQVIGLGPAVVPFLLRELDERPDEWFWALRAITKQDPVPEGERGRLLSMRAAWLAWGRVRGFRW